MFPNGLFAPRYFAPRYWPRPAAGDPAIAGNLDERVFPLDVQPIEVRYRMPEGRSILPLIAAILADEL